MKARAGILAVSAVLAMVVCGAARAADVAPAATVPAVTGVEIKQKNADTNDIPDPFPSSYTLPGGEVLTAANVQSPPPADGKLSPLAGVRMTVTDNPDKTKVAVFEWKDNGAGATKRRVILTPDTVVDFNGKLGTIYDIDEAKSKGAVVAYVAKDGVYAVMLRFGHGLLQVSADDLSPQQVQGLRSIAPTPSAASNQSFEKKAAGIAAGLQLNDQVKEKAVYEAVLTQTKAVRDAHNAGFRPAKSVHADFNTALASVLTADQIDKVKDALTGDKTRKTFQVYHEIVTDLSAEDDKVILGLLNQAREESLDVKNLEEMAPIYKTYKNQIEAYIDSHGRDYKSLYKKFVDGQKAAGNNNPAP